MKHLNIKFATKSVAAIALMASGLTAYGGPDGLVSKASNIGGITNTRHNMTQSYLPQPAQSTMNLTRNDYGEVCVYCHTPHAANTQIALPLWNRSIPATTYNTYNSSSLTQPVSQPGPNSLSCLSCHDGTVSIDAVINMPTTSSSANYNQIMERAPTNAAQAAAKTAFLNTWVQPDADPFFPYNATHASFVSPTGGCNRCHSDNGVDPAAPDFSVFVLGSDLTNDHPVGVRYPTTGPGVDFNATTGTHNNISYFDGNGNSKLDSSDIRLYNTGAGFEVECASCHDPHGVPSNGVGSVNNKSFMRISNSGSSLCLTCHVK